MEGIRLERLSLLSGTVAVVLFIVAALLFGVWDYLPTAERLAETLTDDGTTIMIAGYLGVVAAFFMIWFAGSLYRVLRRGESDPAWLSTTAFGGGLAAGIAIAIGFSIVVVSAARGGTATGISPAEAIALYDVYSQVIGQVFALGMAVLMVATAIASLRSPVFPAWAAWLSIVIAVGLLTPWAWMFLFVAAAWLVAVSVWLYLREPATT